MKRLAVRLLTSTALLFVGTEVLWSDPLLEPLPLQTVQNQKKAALGRALFFDPILSRDGTISCAHCHDLENGGDDGRPRSVGIEGRLGTLNTPTVFNAVFNFKQFWDGRAKTLQEQAEGSITDPKEMDNSFENLIETLKKSPYRNVFDSLYPDGVTKNNILDAIAEFEKGLLTPSPFDRYLRGDKEALTPTQKEGYLLFREKGCVICHHGVNLGGTMYSRFGVVEPDGAAQNGDEASYALEEKEAFKVPTLRNVALTAPYFHDGRTADLAKAVAIMAEVQLGRSMTPEQIRKIVAFLHALSGTLSTSGSR